MTDPGEQLVPSDFVPLTPVPAAVRKIFTTIFGTQPDRFMLNFRLAQLMPPLHDTELVEFVLAFDPRITYWPLRDTRLFKDAYRIQVTNLQHADGELTPIGELVANESTGTTQFKWRVDVTSGSVVTVTTLSGPKQAAASNYTLTEGRSGLIPLLGSTLQFNFTGPVGTSWYVDATAKPQRSMGDILAALKSVVTGAEDRELFGTALTGDQATWRALWREHPYYAYQLGGLLLGAANYLDRQR